MIHLRGALTLRWLWLCFCLAFLFACARRGPEERLRITGADSPVISPDTALELAGEGLPSGERLVVELKGNLAAPGQDPRTIEVSSVGHVLAPERLSVALDAALVRRWGRASFDGEVRVSCEPSAHRRCRGTLAAAAFDVDVMDPRAEQRQRHVVEQLLPALGLTISDADSVAQGLLLAEVEPNSPAARAGLRPGDTIIRSNGVRLHALADLAPGPGATALALQLRRAGGRMDAVRLSLVSAAPLADPRTFALCLLACPALLLLLRRLPLPTPAEAMDAFRLRWAALRAGADRSFGVGAALCLLLSAASAAAPTLPDPFLLLALQLGCVLALRAPSLDVLGWWLAVASAAVLSGTRSWAVIAHDQLGGPWAWNALSRPPLALALGLALLHAARWHAQPRSGLFAVSLDRTSRALLCGLCALLFLGGSQLQSNPALGALLLSVKTLGCYALLAALPPWSLSKARLALAWSALLLGSLLWPWLSPGRSFELLLGSVLCVFGAFWALVACWQGRRSERQPAELRGEPSPAASS